MVNIAHIKKVRTDRKISQKDMAFEIGCSVKEYQDKENGKADFTETEVHNIALFWGVSKKSLYA